MSLQQDELRAWLGAAGAAELTQQQFDRLLVEANRIQSRWPDAGDIGIRDAALRATTRYVLGNLDIDHAGADLLQARARADEAYAAAERVAAMAVEDGMSESKAARRAGIDRMSVRKALGKRS